MALDRTHTRGDDTLRPSRWPGWPGGGSVLRWALATALLVVALAVFYLDQSPPRPEQTATTPKSGRDAAAGAPPDYSDNRGGPIPAPGNSSGASPTVSAERSAVPLPPGMVGVPIRLAEPAALTVARPGARVDLLAVPGGDQSGEATKPTVVASRVLVLDVLATGQTDGPAGAIYLALRSEQAQRAVAMPESTRFAIIVRS